MPLIPVVLFAAGAAVGFGGALAVSDTIRQGAKVAALGAGAYLAYRAFR